MRRSISLLPPLCLALATLAGCGNKGPLVLPPKPPRAIVPTTAKPGTVPAHSSTAATPARAGSTANPLNDQP
jgi:predicted small lipoprotein YifL